MFVWTFNIKASHKKLTLRCRTGVRLQKFIIDADRRKKRRKDAQRCRSTRFDIIEPAQPDRMQAAEEEEEKVASENAIVFVTKKSIKSEIMNKRTESLQTK